MFISDLQRSDFDVSLTGFEEAEIAEKDVKDDDFDLTEALEKESFVERGDIWTVGKHRLMCVNATRSERRINFNEWKTCKSHRDRPTLCSLV